MEGHLPDANAVQAEDGRCQLQRRVVGESVPRVQVQQLEPRLPKVALSDRKKLLEIGPRGEHRARCIVHGTSLRRSSGVPRR